MEVCYEVCSKISWLMELMGENELKLTNCVTEIFALGIDKR